jgi:hypothetical protein
VVTEQQGKKRPLGDDDDPSGDLSQVIPKVDTRLFFRSEQLNEDFLDQYRSLKKALKNPKSSVSSARIQFNLGYYLLL